MVVHQTLTKTGIYINKKVQEQPEENELASALYPFNLIQFNLENN
jgi:hypothetical protein